jgi:hypothetical protein
MFAVHSCILNISITGAQGSTVSHTGHHTQRWNGQDKEKTDSRRDDTCMECCTAGLLLGTATGGVRMQTTNLHFSHMHSTP